METNLTIDLMSEASLQVGLREQETQTISLLPDSGVGTRNYNNLTNRPAINNVTLTDNKNATDLHLFSENTERGWEATPMYRPKIGEICLYSDVGRIKIGDGVVPIVDLPFVNDNDFNTVMSTIQNHTLNSVVHISLQDRAFWDAKLNCSIVGEQLILHRN